MNIFEKMAAITSELQTVSKNLTVSAGTKNAYKAVSERDIIDAVKPLEAKYKVYSYPYDREVLESQILESEKTYNGQTTKSTSFFSRIKTVYRFVNIEEPREYIDMVTFSEGIDPQDKGSGKAMTYADKYALMKAYKISTGDDPDQNASEEKHYNTVSNIPQKTQGKQSPRNMLIAKLHELGINVNEYAKNHGLNGQTSQDVFVDLLADLEAGIV